MRASVSSLLTTPTGQRRLLRTVSVREVATRNVVTIGADEPISRAAALMLERKIGCLPVVERGELVGIVTETDLLRALTPGTVTVRVPAEPEVIT